MKPIYKIGDLIGYDGVFDFKIVDIKNGKYISDRGAEIIIEYQYQWELSPATTNSITLTPNR